MEIDPIIPQRMTRQLLGDVSDMTLYRWRRDPKNPLKLAIKINNRNYDQTSNVIETIEFFTMRGEE